MNYTIELKKRAVKDLQGIPLQERLRLIERIDALKRDLSGDVKKLTNHTPEYRMRSGQWRVLFEMVGDRIIIYRVLHRRESYR